MLTAKLHTLQPTAANEPVAVNVDNDTIAAIITGAYQGTVSIIRISGPDAVNVATRIFRRGKPPSTTRMRVDGDVYTLCIFSFFSVGTRHVSVGC